MKVTFPSYSNKNTYGVRTTSPRTSFGQQTAVANSIVKSATNPILDEIRGILRQEAVQKKIGDLKQFALRASRGEAFDSEAIEQSSSLAGEIVLGLGSKLDGLYKDVTGFSEELTFEDVEMLEKVNSKLNISSLVSIKCPDKNSSVRNILRQNSTNYSALTQNRDNQELYRYVLNQITGRVLQLQKLLGVPDEFSPAYDRIMMV